MYIKLKTSQKRQIYVSYGFDVYGGIIVSVYIYKN